MRSRRKTVAAACCRRVGFNPSGFAPIRLSAMAAALFVGAAAVYAAPQGGLVESGNIKIQQTSASRLDILQSTQRGIINWQSFNVAANESVNFVQPSVSSVTLNRISGVDPSSIFGHITANGAVYFVNPNGLVIGPHATVNVGSLVATTANISSSNFTAGNLKFDQAGSPGARIANQGTITAAQGGLVALVAPGVANSGVIQARLGRVALASGNQFTLDLYGDQLVRLAVAEQLLNQLTDARGQSLSGYVNQTGTIAAADVLIGTAAAKSVLDNVINMSGVVRAQGFEQRGGQIVLLGGGQSNVTVSGLLDTSGSKGGSITVTGQDV